VNEPPVPVPILVGTACLVAVASLTSFACDGSVPQNVQQGRRPVGPAAGPSIVLVTLDTLRADRLASDGPMPRLRELAAGGAVFRRAHAQVPLTLPSHTTILTGRGVRGHGVRDNIGYALGPEIPTVAERFSSAGYATAAFVGGYPLVRSFGLGRGFDLYDDRMTRAPPTGRSGHTERRAEQVVDAALDWVRRRTAQPLFVWVHLFDPHDPYEAPPPFDGRFSHPYDDEVAYTDHQLGRLFDGIGRHVDGDVWTIVTADHGEALGEHGEATHGVLLYEPTIHVPLVIAPPGTIAPKVVDTSVSLIDVAPTLLEAAGLPLLDGCDGRSLLPYLRGDGAAPADGALYLESIHGRRKYGWAPLAGFLDWPQKFVSAPRPELYDLERDPRERRNLAGDADLNAHEERLRKIRDAPLPDARRTTSAADLDRLAGLGYVGAVTAPPRDDIFDEIPRPDPKERIAALAPLERGLAAMAAGRAEQAGRELDSALRLDPDNLVALNNLGILAMQAGEVERAAELFARGLERDDDAAQLANNLGMARSRQGRQAEAVAAYRRALAARPGFTAARFNLALALYRSGKREAALRELERVRTEQPDYPDLENTIERIRAAAP
jgi:arylsulfatase A-like enzyme